MAQSSSASKPLPITQVGDYRVEEQLGKGGMGIVFKATHVPTGGIVALKVLPPKHSRNPGFVQRFIREVHSVSRLSHPNVVTAYEAGQSPEGYLYLAMEYVEGESARRRVKRDGAIPEPQAIEVVLGVARALEHAEQAGLVHRDIKPDNVLLASDGTPKVADFGLAKAPDDPTITQIGSVIGSPAFMSPEQAKGDVNPGIRSDIYSLGATFFYMVVGRPPFEGETAGVVIAKQIGERAPLACELSPAVSENTSRVIAKMLAKDPAARYQRPAELIADLERLRRGEPPQAAFHGFPATVDRHRLPIAERPKRKERPRFAKVAGLAAVAVLAVVIVAHFAGYRIPFSDTAPAATMPGTSGQSTTSIPEAPPPADAEQRILPQTADQETSGAQTEPGPGTDAPQPDVPAEPSEPQPAATLEAPVTDAGLEALKTAAAYRESHPEDYSGQIRQYQAIVADYDGQPVAQQAGDCMKEIEAKWDSEARQKLDEIRQKAEVAVKESRFGAALVATDEFPPYLKNKRRSDELEKLRAAWLSAAEAAFQELDRQATQAVSAGRFDDARQIYRKAILFDVTTTSAAAWKALRKVEEAERLAAETAWKEKADHLELWIRLKDELENGNLPKALDMTREAVKSFRSPDVRAELAADEADIRRLQNLASMVEKGVQTLKPGQAMTFGAMQGTFKEYKDGRIMLTEGKIEFGHPVDRLSLQERLDLAMRAMDPASAETDVTLALAHFYTKRANLTRVRQHIRAAQDKGADVRHLNALFERMDRIKAEEEAKRLWAEVEDAAGKKRWEAANKGISALLEDYGNTKVVRANRGRLDELLEMAVAWPRFRDGLVFLWLPAKAQREFAGKKEWFHKLEARGEAKFDDHGFLRLKGGAFLAPTVNESLLAQCTKTHQLTIEAVLETVSLEQSGPARIVSFSTDAANRNFTLGHEGKRLILRLRVSETGRSGNGHEVTMCDIPERRSFHLAVTYVPNRLTCYLDGKKAYETEEVRGDFSTWEPHHFILGDELKDPRSWDGTIRALAIYSRAMGGKDVQESFEACQRSLQR